MSEPAKEPARKPPQQSVQALGQVLESCRGYLLQIAQDELDPALAPKGGASDLVQQTMLDAVRDFDQFQGSEEAELRAWLRRLLRNNLIDFARRFRDTNKRAVGREWSLQGDASSQDLAAIVPADQSSPSSQAMGHEQDRAIQRALARLPADYQMVLSLRFQEDCSFDEIGRRLNLTANAARKLWTRALKRLQMETKEP